MTALTHIDETDTHTTLAHIGWGDAAGALTVIRQNPDYTITAHSPTFMVQKVKAIRNIADLESVVEEGVAQYGAPDLLTDFDIDFARDVTILSLAEGSAA